MPLSVLTYVKASRKKKWSASYSSYGSPFSSLWLSVAFWISAISGNSYWVMCSSFSSSSSTTNDNDPPFSMNFHSIFFSWWTGIWQKKWTARTGWPSGLAVYSIFDRFTRFKSGSLFGCQNRELDWILDRSLVWSSSSIRFCNHCKKVEALFLVSKQFAYELTNHFINFFFNLLGYFSLVFILFYFLIF